MILTQKPLSAISESDVQSLIDDQVRESKTIDYKRSLPGGSDSDKREFLADVSSFANASGGDLLFGVAENEGLPVEIVPLQGDMDAEVSRLEATIRTGIDPRTQGVDAHVIPVSGGSVLLIRIPQGWSMPHMVTYKGLSRFFSRTSAGKYPLDVHELRTLFARSGDAAERIRRFRDERLAKIVAGEGAFEMDGQSLTVLHLIPFSMGDGGAPLNLKGLDSRITALPPLYSGGYSSRYNLDGFTTFKPVDSRADTYTQLFRDGAIEAVDSRMLKPPFGPLGDAIGGRGLANELAQTLPKYFDLLRDIGGDLPLAVMLTFIGVKGFNLADSGQNGGRRVDRDILQAPEVIVDNWDPPVIELIQPILDAVWNAAGYSHCGYYEDGAPVSFPRW